MVHVDTSLTWWLINRTAIIACAATGALFIAPTYGQIAPIDVPPPEKLDVQAGQQQSRDGRIVDDVSELQNEADTGTVDVWPLWSKLDDARSPLRPELDRERVFPELVVYSLIRHVSAGALEQAIEQANLLVAIAPETPAAHYNRACVLAMLGRSDDAFAALDEAVDLGWRHHAHMQVDSSLDRIREDARFQKVMSRIERLTQAEAIQPMPLRVDEPLDAILASLDERVPELLERYNTPGAAIAIVRDGRVSTATYGERDVRGVMPVTDNTVFRVNAPARLLTALAALRFDEIGLWDLDAPITTYLPWMPFNSIGVAEQVTLRRILTYTAGIRYRQQLDVPESLDAEIRESFLIAPSRIDAKYGHIPQSYLMIGRAMEEALFRDRSTREKQSGDTVLMQSSASIVRSHLVVPLAMRSTLLNQPGGGHRHVVATGHTAYGTPYRDPISPLRPDSPIYANATDLGRLLSFLMSDSGDPRAPLSPDVIASIYETGLPLEKGGFGYGLGVKVIDTPYGRCAETSGVEDGVGSLMRWYPDSGFGVVVLFNASTGLDAARRIAHEALGGI